MRRRFVVGPCSQDNTPAPWWHAMWRLLRARAVLCIASFTLLVDAGEPQAPCPQGGEACLEGRSLGPTADELSALGAGLKCPGLHDGPDFATALAAKFKAHDKDGNGHLNVAEAEDYLASLAPGVAGRIEACLSGHPALAPVAALAKRNTCALCYSFVDAGEHLWPLRVYKDSGLCATSRLCEMGFALTTL